MAHQLPALGRPGRDHPGDILVAAWQCLRRRPLAYAVLSIAPALLGTVALAVPAAIAVALQPGRLDGFTSGLLGALGVALVVIGALVNLRVLAMISALTHATAQGESIGVADAARRSRGFFGRATGLVLLGAGVVLLVGSGLVWLIARWLYGTAEPQLIPVIVTVLIAGAAWTVVGARLYPLLPVLALGRAGGVRALGEAWRLTAGHTARTLGWVTMLGALTWLLRVLALLPVALLAAAANPGADAGSQLGAGWASLLLTIVLAPVVALFSVAYLTAAQTLYERDLVERRPAPPTLNWAPPTTAPAGGIGGQGWRPGALTGPPPASRP
ncbi:hypothetical protein GGQ54_002623 [Naumannella cuiyingiana]|uniref:Glycerophosphoryl diester phosphodiesterase membrane domain-containing protein n=1 Tax=Naumannella cuiyingiana TaxID=1347891 RepID=A0A7Z0ILY6_9ACTN|nr:hypothetical protein [Naumannella cuiyingiana]NYI72063.1 hypothetical protein [Naumannella cuiyingiana]